VHNAKAGARILCALLVSVTTLAAQALPGGAGAAVVEARCATCHETDVITSQRLSLSGWIREIDKMTRWGAMVSDADRAVLAPYLAQQFGADRSGVSAANAAAADVFARACLTCHDRDIIAGQRLTHAGWLREVEKMMRWGAIVSEADKNLLVADLYARFGPRSAEAR
jgi:cytochrome c5